MGGEEYRILKLGSLFTGITGTFFGLLSILVWYLYYNSVFIDESAIDTHGGTCLMIFFFLICGIYCLIFSINVLIGSRIVLKNDSMIFSSVHNDGLRALIPLGKCEITLDEIEKVKFRRRIEVKEPTTADSILIEVNGRTYQFLLMFIMSKDVRYFINYIKTAREKHLFDVEMIDQSGFELTTFNDQVRILNESLELKKIYRLKKLNRK